MAALNKICSLSLPPPSPPLSFARYQVDNVITLADAILSASPTLALREVEQPEHGMLAVEEGSAEETQVQIERIHDRWV